MKKIVIATILIVTGWGLLVGIIWMRSHRTLDTILKDLNDPDKTIRSNAFSALDDMFDFHREELDKRVIPALINLLDDKLPIDVGSTRQPLSLYTNQRVLSYFYSPLNMEIGRYEYLSEQIGQIEGKPDFAWDDKTPQAQEKWDKIKNLLNKFWEENKDYIYLVTNTPYSPTCFALDQRAKAAGIPTEEYRKTHPWSSEPNLNNLTALPISEVRKLLDDKYAVIRSAAVEALGKLGDRESIPAIRKLFEDKDEYVRSAAVFALYRLGDQESIPAIRKLLEDKDELMQSSAVDVLGYFDDNESIPAIRKLLKVEKLRQEVIYALGRLDDQESIPEIRKLLDDKDRNVRGTAIRALGKLGDREFIIPEIRKLITDTFVGDDAIYTLGFLGDKESIPEIRKQLKNESFWTRLDVIYALGKLGDKESIPEIRKLLKDKDANMRSAAVYALGNIGDKDAIPEIIGLLKDEDISVRSWSAVALVELGAKDKVPKEVREHLSLSYGWGGDDDKRIDAIYKELDEK